MNKYSKEIKPGVFVDVYDVLKAWNVTNPALQHLLKKALQPGDRGSKTRQQDLQEIFESAKRAMELETFQYEKPIYSAEVKSQSIDDLYDRNVKGSEQVKAIKAFWERMADQIRQEQKNRYGTEGQYKG